MQINNIIYPIAGAAAGFFMADKKKKALFAALGAAGGYIASQFFKPQVVSAQVIEEDLPPDLQIPQVVLDADQPIPSMPPAIEAPNISTDIDGDPFPDGSMAHLAVPHQVYSGTVISAYMKMGNGNWATHPMHEEYFVSLGKLARNKQITLIVGPQGQGLWQVGDPNSIPLETLP